MGRERFFAAQEVNKDGEGISGPFGLEVLTLSGQIPFKDELKIKILHAGHKSKHVRGGHFMNLCMILKV